MDLHSASFCSTLPYGACLALLATPSCGLGEAHAHASVLASNRVFTQLCGPMMSTKIYRTFASHRIFAGAFVCMTRIKRRATTHCLQRLVVAQQDVMCACVCACMRARACLFACMQWRRVHLCGRGGWGVEGWNPPPPCAALDPPGLGPHHTFFLSSKDL